MNQETIAHLQFLQAIVDRMNRNSFQLKGWCITLVAAFLALYANGDNIRYIFVAIFPTLAFAFLDAYYLQQERKFRGIYNDVVSGTGKVEPFAMPIQLYCGKKYAYWNVVVSKTIVGFYAPIVLLLVVGGSLLCNAICCCAK